MDRSDCEQAVTPAISDAPLAGPETEARAASDERTAPPPGNMRDAWRERCLSDFRDWLYALTEDELEGTLQGGAVDGEAYGSAFEEEEPEAAEPDLETLFGELAALRQETRLVGRAGQQSERQLGALAETLRAELREQGERLARTAADLKAQLPAARREAQGAVLTELLAVRAALEDTLRATRARTLPARPWLAAARRLLDEGATGAQLALDKADDALRRLSIAPVAEAGAPFDPKWMRAVATVARANLPTGTVVTVLRQGWRREDQILQTAEVEVARNHE
jgi:molecular chaperone GrpE (heat shock protein)